MKLADIRNLMAGYNVAIETCTFVPVTAIVPEEWIPFFFQALSSDAPFSWGDNNRTLINKQRVTDHCREALGDFICRQALDAWVDFVMGLDAEYIDLEN